MNPLPGNGAQVAPYKHGLLEQIDFSQALPVNL